MFLKKYKLYPVILFSLFSFPQLMHAQTDSLFLTVDQLFERGVQYSLQLQADAMKESMAQERTRTARTARLPELQIGLKGGFVGQPVVWERGLSAPLYPDAPDWSQNYAIDLAQPLYQGGKIRSAIHKHEILMRNIEESELRLHDIRRMKKEGLITNNDVLRSEMQLTNDRLSLQETENSIVLVSQQLDILLGQDESVLLRPDTALLYRAVALQSYDDYIVQAYANNPVMKLLRAQTELARNEIRSTKSFSLPGISLYASNTLARPVSRTLADMYNNNWNVGVSVSYPLSSLYKNNHKIKESKMRMSLRKNEEEQKMQGIRMEVRSAFLRHREAMQRVEALKLSVRQAEENYRIMQNRYLNQLAILTDLLDANSVRLNVELQLVTARTRVIYTYYQLQKACGRL